ncbi:MAG: transcription antitermination factor NusB [Spirochaetaceae bacterium]|nr:MAG: transcription antitermination factor NusB [Spirochaetaceae bacterium]
MGSRRKGRIIAFQALYGWDATNNPIDSVLAFDWVDGKRDAEAYDDTIGFARLITAGTIENIDAVDDAIKARLKHWDFSRLSRVDLAILRMSVYCLLYQTDIPRSVTIDEAIDIAKEFGGDGSYKFVNGVLDGVGKAEIV